MAATRPPGHLAQLLPPGAIEDGTLGRSATPRPGLAGGDVARWPLERKLIEAARRTTAKLPREMRSQFAVLFEPESIAITGVVLVAWAGSHLVGAGEVVDVVLLLIALGTVGWQAFQVGRDVGAYLRIASGAMSEADLDRAADRLAAAVATVGVTVFVALVFKAGTRIGGAARAAVAARSAFWGRTIEECLILLGKPKAPPLVRERLEVALKYFRKSLSGRDWDTILGFLKGIDFSKPVRLTTLRRGEMLAKYGYPERPGSFLTKIGTGMDRLGINPKERSFFRYEVVEDVEVLESHVAPIADTWTDKGTVPVRGRDGAILKANKKYQAGGGGTQYIVDVGQLLKSGILREVPRP